MNLNFIFDWQTFLRFWDDEVMRLLKNQPTIDWLDDYEIEAVKKGTLFSNPASAEGIAQLEAKLRKPLSPTYKDFLRVTDGWFQLGFHRHAINLKSCLDVDWFEPSQNFEWWYSALEEEYCPVPDEQYFVYGEKQEHIRLEYFATLLQLTDYPEVGGYFLNPKVIFEDGEWEAWVVRYDGSGVDRYKSFKDMMLAEYKFISAGLVEAFGSSI